jgi:hypothetical protein
MFRPRCGRQLKSQCSPEDLRGQPTQAPGPHTMATQGGHPPAADLDGRTSYASSLSRSAYHCQPPPTTTTKSKSTLRWPSTASASFERQAPTSGRRRAVMDLAGDHADPGHPSRAAGGPTATPRDLIPVGHSGRRNARTPGAGHWTPGRSGTRTGHRSRGQAPWTPDARTGHWTPDVGHERGHRDDSTAGIRTFLAATPSDRTLRPATVLMLSHNQPAARPPPPASGASAHCSPRTISGRE